MAIVEPLDQLSPQRRHRLSSRIGALLVMTTITYLVVAYLLIPAGWRRVESRHPALRGMPTVSQTKDKIPGDPLNLALISDEVLLTSSMLKAGWHAADAITFRSSLRIADDTVLRRPDESAPVSSLYVWGKKQDLAFEFPVGHDPRRRHHVRFWRSTEVDPKGLPLWVGGATYDFKVGFSHTTLEITHHISPDVDAERDKIIADLQSIGAIAKLEWINGFQPRYDGRNGGGDAYHTDGRLPVMTLQAVDAPIKAEASP